MSTLKLIRSSCLVVVCIVIAACSKQEPSEGKPKEGTPGSGQATPQGGTPPVVSNEPEVKDPKEFLETAESFTLAFEKDHPAAVRKYAGRIVEVTGEFLELFENTWEGEPELVLRLRGCGVNEEPGFARLHCKITNKQFESDMRVRALSRGQRITLRGKAQDNRDASITDCVVVRLGPSTAIPTTLREIEEEVGQDPDHFGRFKDRDVIVKVTLGDPRFPSRLATFPVASTAGGKKSFVFEGLRLGEEYDKELTALKSGDEVLFVARVSKPLLADSAKITFSGTRLLKSLPEGLKLPEAPK